MHSNRTCEEADQESSANGEAKPAPSELMQVLVEAINTVNHQILNGAVNANGQPVNQSARATKASCCGFVGISHALWAHDRV